jgi:TPP-dependent pyruvate/acetoin dehydrogenase alpha subunit
LPGTALGYQLVGYQCMGQSALGVVAVAADAVELVMRPSPILPEVRTCRRSHSP